MSDLQARAQLLELLAEIDAGELSDQQTEQLEQLLIEHPELQKSYLRRIAARTQLTIIARRRANKLALPPQAECAISPNQAPQSKSAVVLAIAASLLLIVTLGSVFWFSQQSPLAGAALSDTSPPIASITRIADCWWSAPEMSAALGQRLSAGQNLWLESGLVEITMRSGAMITMVGPCQVQIADSNSIFLSQGIVHALAPHDTIDFTIKTEQIDIIDLGTKFTVSVDQQQAVEVHVHEGTVSMRRNSVAKQSLIEHLVLAGKSIRFSPTAAVFEKPDGFTPFRQIAPANGKHIAYTTRAGTVGNQLYEGKVGHDFIVNETIEVTRLGVFDSNSDGLQRALFCEIWQRDDRGTPDDFRDDYGIVMAGRLPFTPDDPGELIEGNRFKSLEAPLTLPPGNYTIVAFGYGNGEPLGNDQYQVGLYRKRKSRDDGQGVVSFVGSSRYGDQTTGPHAFPGIVDKFWADRYSAGTFEYRLLDPSSTTRESP
ncbi:FecR family protein [Blastopirellula sp. J2-11]|uniref:FecR family protein n=1 Tax=Blastopirellula sp. J2-11 TaxID=2943192 RepID=UPI0021CA4889|nr:FecR family protein [Blastopirellula sp. J2-11]UUO06653.1 FecR family protein [Blastopirellula sp. J2-11]